jgi:hypothetical protein
LEVEERSLVASLARDDNAKQDGGLKARRYSPTAKRDSSLRQNDGGKQRTKAKTKSRSLDFTLRP